MKLSATSSNICRAAINYYAFNGFFKLMQNNALDGIRNFSNDKDFRLYYAISLFHEARYQEAIRECEALIDDEHLTMAAILVEIKAHKSCKSLDQEEIDRLENKIASIRGGQQSEWTIYYAALALLLIGSINEAAEFVDKMIKFTLPEKLSLIGWINLMGKSFDPSIEENFDSGLVQNDVNSILGKVKCLQKLGLFSKAISLLNQLIANHGTFLPALIEKMKLQIALKNWDEAIETAQKTFIIDRHCIEAQRHLIVHDLIWLGDGESGSSRISNLIASLDIREASNGRLYHETGKLISSLCCNNRTILNYAFSLCEKAITLDCGNVDYQLELANICIKMMRLSNAKKIFNTIYKSSNNLQATVGLLHVCVLKDAIKSSDEVGEMEKLSQMTKEHLYVIALWYKKTKIKDDKIAFYVDKILQDYQLKLRTLPLGVDFFLQLDPSFIIKVIQLIVDDSNVEPFKKGENASKIVLKCKQLIEFLVSCCPGLHECLYYMAKINYLCGELNSACCFLNRINDQSDVYLNGLLLSAKILLLQGKHQEAENKLETALGKSFEVRDQVEYILIKAEIHKNQAQFEKALKILNQLLQNQEKGKISLTKDQVFNLKLEIIEITLLKEEIEDAENLLQEMSTKCTNELQETEILIKKAKILQTKGKIEEAITCLREIKAKKYFIKSRSEMASLYLNYRRDRRLYISCFKEIFDQSNDDANSCIMLGDAYMNVLEPEKAIEIYEYALKKNPKHGLLIRRVGQALIQTHLFERAITYYKAALKTSPDNDLRYELALLLFRIKRFDEAENMVQNGLQIMAKSEFHEQDFSLQEWQVKFMHLQARIKLNCASKEEAIEHLEKVYEQFLRIHRRASIERPDSVDWLEKTIVQISEELAQQITIHFRDEMKAINIYKKVLTFDPENITVLTALERLEINVGNLDQARKYSDTILKKIPNNQESLLLTTDLMLRRADFTSAIDHLQHVLDNKPDFYPALVRFVDAARRVANLEVCEKYIQKSKQSTIYSDNAGINYCYGLYKWYRGDLNEAIKLFNQSRSSSEFSLFATYHIIEIFINQDNEITGNESFEPLQGNSSLVGPQEVAITCATKLLREIHEIAKDQVDYMLISNFVLLAKKQKIDAEIALSEFVKIVNNPRFADNLGALLGIASCFLILKQSPKARSYLKKVMRMEWNYQEAEYLEKCWLLLADIYFQSGKLDSALDLLKKVIHYNKSSVKAYSTVGKIMEKLQNHKEAIISYEMVWKILGNNDPNIGYRLAYGLMKCKRFVDAINVSLKILEKYPEFPKIRKDIIDKCQVHLKNG